MSGELSAELFLRRGRQWAGGRCDTCHFFTSHRALPESWRKWVRNRERHSTLLARELKTTPADTSAALAFPLAGVSPAHFWALRLRPGQDPRVEIQRFARARDGHFEIVSLIGTLSKDGMHLHAAFSGSTGATFGGHLMDGSVIYITAEIVIGELDHVGFAREQEPASGYHALLPRKR